MNKFIPRILLAVLLVAGFMPKASAQQDPSFSLYMFDKLLVSPSFCGSSNYIVGALKYRQQFTGIEGKPVTETFTLQIPLQKRYMGVGFKIIQDQLGVTKQTTASFIYSYHLGFGNGKLSFGLDGGVISQTIDFTSLERLDPVDNIIPENKEDIIVPDANFGISYQSRDFYFSMSAAHLLGSKLTYPNTITPNEGKLNSHFFLASGYTFDLSKNVSIEPSTLIKYVKSAPVEADINVNLGFYEHFFIGASYRTKDAVAAIVKIHVTKSLRIAYSYDFNLSKLGQYSQGAHEVMLSYGIKLAVPASEKEIHPRYYF